MRDERSHLIIGAIKPGVCDGAQRTNSVTHCRRSTQAANENPRNGIRLLHVPGLSGVARQCSEPVPSVNTNDRILEQVL